MSKIVDKSTQDNVLMLQVLEAIKSIKYGCVQITVHNFEVVQIDKIEKIRIRKQETHLLMADLKTGTENFSKT